MRDLTQDEIRDLEARGIKPGVLLRCAYIDEDTFTFNDWNEVVVNEGIQESIKVYKDIRAFWILDAATGRYATPVEQPKPTSPLWIPTPEPAPIDWEARRWELATQMFIKEIHNGPRHIEKAISNADDFIREYRNTPQP